MDQSNLDQIYQSDFIKQECRDNTIIQNIDVKSEPHIDSEVVIQTVDIKIQETQQELEKQPGIKQKRHQKRWSKRTILENRYEDEQPAVKVIKITDINAFVSKPKVSKAKRKYKEVKDINSTLNDCKEQKDDSKIENNIPSSNLDYIKAEEELQIEDTLTGSDLYSFGASVPQNSNPKPRKIRKIQKKSQNSKTDDQEFGYDFQDHQTNQQNIQIINQISINPQESYQTHSIDAECYPTEPQNFPSTSQTQDNLIYTTEPEFISTVLKQDENFKDQDTTTDPTYQNPQIDSDESDSDSSNSNYRFEDDKFTCVHCNMRFKLLKNFDKHDCLICKECKKVFTTRCALKRHINHIHTETDEIFECKDCNKVFKAKKYLETHINSHEKIHECENCGMKFGNTSRLNEHRIKHRNPEILTCKLCDRKCASRSSLKFHMRVHDVDRLKHLKCDKCSFTTDDNRTLVKHQKSHVKQEEKFKMSSEWLKCEKCPARLKNKQSLNNHMYYVHSEMSFQCNLCGIVVKTERNLKRHWKNIHEHENK